jgi:hypothetical protein
MAYIGLTAVCLLVPVVVSIYRRYKENQEIQRYWK